MSEKFSLKWNDFKSTVSNSFGILREEKDFFDVTLVSDDERQIPAHKLVLSALSALINATEDEEIEDPNIKYEGRDEKSPKPKAVADDIEVFGFDGQVENEVGRISKPERTVAVTVNDNSVAEETIQKNLVREVGGYSCKICNFSRKLKIDVTRHIETHIEGLSYSCSVCQKTFRSRNSLNVHKANYQKF